ncbi:phage baseplate assembly protein V, partial [Capnocytophaga catalasegens]|uniref:phage baseplate assembly protein V n=1 Tax=Capnocytophaga catalasegens TaxID=1004260 RepID=UPI00223226B7
KRVVQPHAGGGKGFYFIPEIGEEVWVDFEDQNAERPFVVGSNYNGKEFSPFHNKNNDVKAIQTRSGVKIKIDDSNGSLFLEDPSGNNIYMDGKQKISFNGATLEFNAQRIIMNATERTEITTNDYILNALSKIYVFSSWFKQQINGFMHLFSNSALINTTNAIDIEAKEAKLLGTEKSIVHSDNVAVVNSLGTAELKGKQGNKYTQKAEEVSSTPAEEIGLAVVHFRPLDTWRGEFGFDWLRVNDGEFTKKEDPPYQYIIQGGYTNLPDAFGNPRDLDRIDAYKQLKTEYQMHPIKRHTSTNTDNEYFVPYISLFSREYVKSLPNLLVKPKFRIKVRVLVEIEEDIDRLEFEYDKELLHINKNRLNHTKRGTLKDGGNIVILCKKDLAKDTDIKIYAYPKTNPSIENRKLAGRIIVIQNDKRVRKEEKIVLVEINTNIDKRGRKEEGKFSKKEKINLYNSLYQSLIIPSIEETSLDISDNSNFQVGGRYFGVGNTISHSTSLHTDLPLLFFSGTDASGNLINNRFLIECYFTIFKFGIPESSLTLLGEVEGIGIRNVIMFTPLDGGDDCTLNHETLHGLGLCHTHRDSIPIKGITDDLGNEIGHKYKYVYPCAIPLPPLHPIGNSLESTSNIMSYREETFSSWHWQWKIINPNIG